jgi:hypothetical protein
MDSDPPKDSVEYHMFTRARQTVTWTDDNNKAVALITDKSSVVDGKLIAMYTSQTTPQKDGLAILPPGAKTHDLIVSFEGARVPFVVRCAKETRSLRGQQETKENLEKDNLLIFVECRIIGECLINGLRDFVKDQADANSTVTVSPGKAFVIS